ncbi:MAG: hypothetical protein JO227_10340 [Acetobacteraceae bacterium]|nr:hypothetical protein [Acetobacteraceae bacterium]
MPSTQPRPVLRRLKPAAILLVLGLGGCVAYPGYYGYGGYPYYGYGYGYSAPGYAYAPSAGYLAFGFGGGGWGGHEWHEHHGW